MTNVFDQIKQKTENVIAADEVKAKAWLGSNWYPFSIGFGAAVLLAWGLHLLKIV